LYKNNTSSVSEINIRKAETDRREREKGRESTYEVWKDRKQYRQEIIMKPHNLLNS
jgi:hypothetical protein